MMKPLCLSVAVAIAFAAACPSPSHAITMDTNTTATLDYMGETVILDTRVSAQPDSFSTNWGVQNCTNVNKAECQVGSARTTRKLGDIGFDTLGFLRLGFDAQEVGGDTALTIFGARLEISESEWDARPLPADIVWNTVWELNAGQDVTTGLSGTALDAALGSPNNVIGLVSDTFGNDVDLIIKIPSKLFTVFSPEALGRSLARITWLQFDYSNGPDEWTLSRAGTPGISFLADGQSVSELPGATTAATGDVITPVPVPAAGALLFSGLGALAWLRRRKEVTQG
jgi:hypothetical protein